MYLLFFLLARMLSNTLFCLFQPSTEELLLPLAVDNTRDCGGRVTLASALPGATPALVGISKAVSKVSTERGSARTDVGRLDSGLRLNETVLQNVTGTKRDSLPNLSGVDAIDSIYHLLIIWTHF